MGVIRLEQAWISNALGISGEWKRIAQMRPLKDN